MFWPWVVTVVELVAIIGPTNLRLIIYLGCEQMDNLDAVSCSKVFQLQNDSSVKCFLRLLFRLSFMFLFVFLCHSVGYLFNPQL
jgi:hypothetical protein